MSPGASPWLLDGPNKIDLIRKSEAEYPLIKEAGCKVGIGVVTGADRIFIGNYDKLDVETCRKLKVVRTKDYAGWHVQSLGEGVINPFYLPSQVILPRSRLDCPSQGNNHAKDKTWFSHYSQSNCALMIGNNYRN